MLKKILIIFLITLAAFSSPLKEQLSRFDSLFLKANENEKLAFHQDLKALYIKSVMDGDDALKIEVLKRLIISSNLLNFSDEAYVKELQAQGFSQKAVADIKAALALLQADIKEKELAKASINTPTLNKALKTNPPPAKIEKKIEKQVLKEALAILSLKKDQACIAFKLNRSIEKEEFKKFTLKNKDSYRYVIDIKASLNIAKKNIDLNELKFDISQYDPKTVRMVFRSKKQSRFKLVLSDKSFKLCPKKELLISDIQALSDGINLSLNYPPKPIVNSFTRQDLFYSVINLQGKLSFKSYDERFGKVHISVRQFDKDSVKVVIKSLKDFEYRQLIKNNKIFLGFKLKPKKPLKPTQINKIKKLENEVYIYFDGQRPKISPSTFKKKNKSFQILSFKAKLKTKKASFEIENQDLSIVQFDKSYARVVLEGKSELDYRFEGDVLILSLVKPSRDYSQKIRKIVMIDAGHGGKDSGAISGGKKEKDVVLAVALKLGKVLKKRGFRVYYTRTRDIFINLRDRTKLANEKGSDLFISIHANALASKKKARKIHGIETFFLSPARSERSKEAAIKENQSDLEEMNYFSQETFLNFLNREKILASNKLAIDVQKQILKKLRKSFKPYDGGVREAPFWVLVGAGMPAILIEIGYITNPYERKLLFNKKYQENLAIGIANGIESYFKKNP